MILKIIGVKDKVQRCLIVSGNLRRARGIVRDLIEFDTRFDRFKLVRVRKAVR